MEEKKKKKNDHTRSVRDYAPLLFIPAGLFWGVPNGCVCVCVFFFLPLTKERVLFFDFEVGLCFTAYYKPGVRRLS